MVDPAKVCLFIPAGLKAFKLDLFNRIGSHIKAAGGEVIEHDAEGALGLVLNRPSGRHIVIAAPTRTYARFHQCEGWLADTLDAISRVTDRQLVIRDKESKRSLQSDLQGAHALVTHGSIAAVEAVILGYPVFVHPDSAAALVGRTDLKLIERPALPDRQPWLNALAYSQFSETELVDGTLWRLLN